MSTRAAVLISATGAKRAEEVVAAGAGWLDTLIAMPPGS